MFFLVLASLIVGDLLFGLFFGIRTLVVLCFLCAAVEILWDWYKRGWEYVSAARFNYVTKALLSVIAIVLLAWFFLLPRHPILWLAVPLLAISIPVAVSKYGHPLMAVLVLASAICQWIPSRYRPG
jgi:FlaA1/EpsC-like NDP-sugar epimerase